MDMELLKQSSDLVLCLQDATMQAAIDGDRERHDRLEKVFHKALKRHGRRHSAIRH